MVKTLCVSASLLAILIPGAQAGAGPTQQTAEAMLGGTSGADVFKTYCGSCHGVSARGDGPLADSLRDRPPNLTLIEKRNGGKFDRDKVHSIIDGRQGVRAHGQSDMPVWGDAFKQSVDGNSEKAVNARIDAIVDYLKSIQVK